MKNVTVILLIIHGLISFAQGIGSFNSAGGVPNPNWLNWYPVPLGQSWLLSRLGLEKSLLATAVGLLGLVSGAFIIAAGLGLLGFVVPMQWWRVLVGFGAVLSLLYLSIYAHPFYAVGVGAKYLSKSNLVFCPDALQHILQAAFETFEGQIS